MNWRKIIKWGVIIFLAWFLITNPHGAAHAATSAWHGLQHVGHSLSTFFTSL